MVLLTPMNKNESKKIPLLIEASVADKARIDPKNWSNTGCPTKSKNINQQKEICSYPYTLSFKSFSLDLNILKFNIPSICKENNIIIIQQQF